MHVVYDPIQYFGFITFFPQLVAGPIERASNLLDQFGEERRFDFGAAADGLRQMLWGVVQEDGRGRQSGADCQRGLQRPGQRVRLDAHLGYLCVFVPDLLRLFRVLGHRHRLCSPVRLPPHAELRLPLLFAGYSGVLAPLAHLLSTWFRDYLYIPLGGNRGHVPTYHRNIMIVFLVSGLWHGANWTFVIWGLLHGLFFLLLPASPPAPRRTMPRVDLVCFPLLAPR